MTTESKEVQENITSAMLPDFERSEENALKVKAWAALGAIDTGVDAGRVCRMFELTLEQIASHRQEWERTQLNGPAPA